MLAILDRRKGIWDLLEAVPLVAKERPTVRFRIAGPVSGGDAELSRYQSKAASLGVEGAIEWVGPVGPSEKRECFESSDIFVIPSYAEGLPIAMLEAMSYGIPVVATPVGGIPEMAQDNREALFVPVRDPTALASAILRLAESPELRARLGASGRVRVQERYSGAVVTAAIERLYLSAAGRNQQVAPK